jgi:hypothetical protein
VEIYLHSPIRVDGTTDMIGVGQRKLLPSKPAKIKSRSNSDSNIVSSLVSPQNLAAATGRDRVESRKRL